MDFKTTTETIPAAENIYSGIQEQTVELDYILPDYYPDIFRLVRCEAVPVITGYSIVGDKLNYELRCDIRILYCGDGSSVLQSVEQHQTFSRTADIGKICEFPEITIVPKSDHINFRAVNKRRLDMRGAVSIKISVTGENPQEVISDAEGMNIQLNKTPVRFASQKLTAEKIFSLSENISLSPAQPDADNIVNVRCRALECEKKNVSGKLLVKGEIAVDMLYSGNSDGECSVEPLSFTLPYSQIVDMDGLDDSFICRVTPEILTCDVTPSADSPRNLSCEAEIRLVCRAVKTASVMLVTDAFSTVYPCEVSFSDISAEQIPLIITENFTHIAVLADGDNVPKNIYAMWCTPKNINTHLSDDGNSLVVSGMLTYSMAAEDNSGTVVMPDRDEAFEENISLTEKPENAPSNVRISVKDVSYNINSNGTLTAKAELSAEITVADCESIHVVSDIVINDSERKKRDGDYAVKLYFGTENEIIWDIAKRCSTSVSAIMEENELIGDRLTNGGMLLIPIVT